MTPSERAERRFGPCTGEGNCSHCEAVLLIEEVADEAARVADGYAIAAGSETFQVSKFRNSRCISRAIVRHLVGEDREEEIGTVSMIRQKLKHKPGFSSS